MSQSTGDGLTEAKNINRSLSALQDVLLALQKKKGNTAQHIPYRNSRLTYLLKVLMLKLMTRSWW
jgi:kinesin family protein C1